MKTIAVILGLLLSNPGWSLRCANLLVYEGDAQYTVKKKCGEPQSIQTLTTTQPLINEAGEIYGSVPFSTEVWIYQKSANDFLYQVYFRDGIVTSITSTLTN